VLGVRDSVRFVGRSGPKRMFGQKIVSGRTENPGPEGDDGPHPHDHPEVVVQPPSKTLTHQFWWLNGPESRVLLPKKTLQALAIFKIWGDVGSKKFGGILRAAGGWALRASLRKMVFSDYQ